MGIGPKISGHIDDTGLRYKYHREYTSPNPDPYEFEIIKHDQVGNYTAILIRYPDATNFEGEKIVVLEDQTVTEVKEAGVMDPHFSLSGNVVARFRPDTVGWADAVSYCTYKNKIDLFRMAKRND